MLGARALATALAALLLGGCAAMGTLVAPTGPTTDHVLRVATSGDPPHLDLSLSSDTLVLLVAGHVFQTLFTWNEDLEPVPLLVEHYEASDDLRHHTLQLRDDVSFHDGSPLRARDVTASLERWGRNSALGAEVFSVVDHLEATGEHTVVLRTREPYAVLPTMLARQLQGAAIHPHHVLEASSPTALADIVGTGPYQLSDWLPGRVLRLERFPDFADPDGPSSGYAGPRTQHLDAIEFVPMPNEATRVASILAGDVQYLADVGPDVARSLPSGDAVVVEHHPPDVWLGLVLNHRSEAFAGLAVRRALQQAIDPEPVLLAAVGPDAYALGPTLLPGAPRWASDAGAVRYDAHDPDAAHAALVTAGAVRTELRFLTTATNPAEHNAALTIAQQLEAVGFVVDLQVLDAAAIGSLRNDDRAWEIYLASASFRPDPVMRNLTRHASGWWENEHKDLLLAQLQATEDHATRHGYWEQVQAALYEDVPRVKIGDLARVTLRSAQLHGVGPSALQPDFSNAWLEP